MIHLWKDHKAKKKTETQTGKRRLWTKEEDKIIVDHYVDKGVDYVAKATGRNKSSVWSRALRLGIKSKRTWSGEDKNKLIKHSGRMTIGEMRERFFPHRSEVAIGKMIQKLGLSPERRSRWTDREKEILARIYPKQGAKAVAGALKNRTIGQIYFKANIMGIKRSYEEK